MLKEWQFNVLFFVGVSGVVLLVIGPSLGLKIGDNPTALTGLGAILTYILTQRNSWTRTDAEKKDRAKNKEEGSDEDDNE